MFLGPLVHYCTEKQLWYLLSLFIRFYDRPSPTTLDKTILRCPV